MRIGTIVTNHNYERFLSDSLGSVLKQSRPADKIIVIDDGSSDGSLAAMHSLLTNCSGPEVKVIGSTHVGQLGALQKAAGHIADCDAVALLDADDFWHPTHLETIERELSHRASEVVFADVMFVAAESSPGKERPANRRPFNVHFNAGQWPVDWMRTVFLRQWFGAPTSAISMRASLLGELVSCAKASDWMLRADDVIVFGAAMRRLHRRWAITSTDRPVRYRCHDSNGFAGRSVSMAERRRRDLAVIELLRTCRVHWRDFSPYERLETFRDEIESMRLTLPAQLFAETAEWLIEAAAVTPLDAARFRSELVRVRACHTCPTA